MDDSSVPQIRPDTRVRRFRGAVLVAGGNDTVEFSETAAFLFTAVDGERSVADIAALLATEYAVPTDVAVADTTEFLAGLVDGGFLELRREGAP